MTDLWNVASGLHGSTGKNKNDRKITIGNEGASDLSHPACNLLVKAMIIYEALWLPVWSGLHKPPNPT